MTVCIAAICQNEVIVMASDRMLTGNGDIEFESSETSSGDSFVIKVTPVNSKKSIAVMMAGHTSLQTEIVNELIHTVYDTEQKNQKTWSVKEVVNLHIEVYNKIRSKRAEIAILSPFGLTMEKFLAEQKNLSDSFIEKVRSDISTFQLDAIETNIVGHDDFGPHIYTLYGNRPICCDGFGFTAIGTGAKHAESQFMLNGYSRIVPQEDALWMVYMAKRKSEIAPGVGKATDLFVMTREKGFKVFNAIIEMNHFDAIYETFQASQKAAFHLSETQIKALLEREKEKFLNAD